MLADARGDDARPRRRADAHPPSATSAATTDFKEHDTATHLEPSRRQRLRTRNGITDNRDNANTTVTIPSLRLNAAHCRHRDPRVALARVRHPRTKRNAAVTSASPALRAALADLPCPAPPVSPVAMLADARDDLAERLQRDHCVRVSRARLRQRARASAALPPDAVPRQRPHRRRCAPRSRPRRAWPLRCPRSPCSLTLAATVLADTAGSTCADATAAREGHVVGTSRSWTAPNTEYVHHLNPTDATDFRACRACIGRVSPALRRIARAMRAKRGQLFPGLRLSGRSGPRGRPVPGAAAHAPLGLDR